MMDLSHIPSTIAATPISKLKLPARISNPLRRAGITDISALIIAYERGLRLVDGLGVSSEESVLQAFTALSTCILPDGGIEWENYYTAMGIDLPVEERNDSVFDSRPNLRIPEEVLVLSIGHLHLGKRAYNALVKSGIKTIADLILSLDNQLKDVIGIGTATLDILANRLQGLADAFDEDGKFSWFIYWKGQGIRIIPASYRLEAI